VVETVELLKDAQLLTKFEALAQVIPAVICLADFLLELVLDQLQPVLLRHNRIIVTIHTEQQLPRGLFLLHRLFQFLLLEVLALHFFPLLLCEFDLLNLGGLLGANPLELDRSAFVIELRHRVPQVKLNVVLLQDVVKG